MCNPVTSLNALKSSENERPKMLKNRSPLAKVLVTSSDENNSAVMSCVFCERQGHGLHKCRKFMEKTVAEQHKFVHKRMFRFGCLKFGHRSRVCDNRSVRDM